MSSAGQPKRFSSGNAILKLFEEFCEEIRHDPESMYIPSKTDFCLWLRKEKKINCDRKTLYNSIDKYFPNIEKDFDEIRANALVFGGIKGMYQPTMTIFALKNWCGWSDKKEEKVDTSLTVTMGEEIKEFSE